MSMSDIPAGRPDDVQGTTVTRSAPLGEVRAGQLMFVRGVSLVSIGADDDGERLFEARFEGPAPRVAVEGGVVTIQHRQLSLIEWAQYALLWGRHATEVRLAASIPWQVDIRGGVSKLNADLRKLRLTGLNISGGAREVSVDLPAPIGIVQLRIQGGASQITLRRPPGCAVRMTVRKGATRIALDAQHFGSVGGSVKMGSPGAADAPDRYDVEVAGGASNLAVDSW